MAIVGAGVAGALLAWRLHRSRPGVSVEVYAARPPGPDATGASGGLVRGFDRDPVVSRLAVDSLAELRGDARLLAAAAYRETGSVYLLPPGSDPTGSVRLVDALLPGSAAVLTGAELTGRWPFRDLPSGTVAVAERDAGFLSPARLRDAVLGWLADAGVAVRPVPVSGVEPTPAVRLADGSTVACDVVVVAAGPWTPAVLRASALPAEGLRTKQIQYQLYRGQPAGLGVFVDDTCGLYGRPDGSGQMLLGVPGDRWDVEPGAVPADPAKIELTADRARRRLGLPAGGERLVRTVASCDCYHEQPGLALREVLADAPVFTFTGGCGGAAKTALAASRAAAAALLDRSPVLR